MFVIPEIIFAQQWDGAVCIHTAPFTHLSIPNKIAEIVDPIQRNDKGGSRDPYFP